MSDPGTGTNPAADGAEKPTKLRELQAAVRDLVRATSEAEIARVAVETARDVLDCPVTGMWLYDAETDRLEPAAVTDEGRELLGEPVGFERGSSLAWEAFETGTVGQYEDVGAVDGAFNPETPVQSEIDLPVGRHGVITTATTHRAEFDDDDVDLLRILASNTEAVLDRTAREREIERYREMVESANDPIWAVDVRGRVTHVNRRCVELSGMSREQMVGAPVRNVFRDEVVERVTELVVDLLSSGECSSSFAESVRFGGGELREYLVSLSVLFEDGEFVGTVFVGHDVTALRENERRLSVFDRVLRHNIRNQLNVVVAHLSDLTACETDRHAVKAERALAAAENLLELSAKASRFQSSIKPEVAPVQPTDVAALSRLVVADARVAHPEATVRTDLPDGAWAYVHGAFEFALEELVENAVRHTDGDPVVDVSIVVSDDSVEVRVADDGPGIPQMERQVLNRGLETPLEHTQGLGLWMVRWTVTNAGGTITVEDDDPRGTVVVIHLPSATTPTDAE